MRSKTAGTIIGLIVVVVGLLVLVGSTGPSAPDEDAEAATEGTIAPPELSTTTAPEPETTRTTLPPNTSQSAVGPLYDPVVAGEETPQGYRPVLERDTIQPVYEPTFLPADEVDWSPSSLVLGVSIDGEAKAYPIIHLNFREMVIDELAGEPILVSWCPLCGTAMAHKRIVDGEEVVFGNQGHLWQNAMTWYDHDTGSIWSQPLGEAILGPLEGTELELIPSTLTSWESWLEAHPESLALDAPGEPSSYRLADMLLVVEFDDQVAAYPFEELRDEGVLNDSVAGVDIAIVLQEGELSSWSVFARQVGDQVLTLGWENGELVDDQTGTVWDADTGFGVEGPLADETLPLLPGFTVFPQDFESFWPEGDVRSVGSVSG